MLSPNQIRAARSFLDWTRDDLAAATDLSAETIRRIESGATTPNDSTARSIKRAFESKGLEFIEQEGVRRAKSDFFSLSGRDGLMRFFDDVYSVMQTDMREIVIYGFDEDKYDSLLSGEFSEMHRSRMSHIKHLKMRCIIQEGDFNMGAGYCEYRWQSYDKDAAVTFYIYGDRIALLDFNAADGPHILMVRNRSFAEAYRRQFEGMWSTAKLPPKRRKDEASD
jgi:DNA-binding XRE family transcriptional regulator